MKRFLALILCLAMLASMFTFTLPVSAADTVYSGDCGTQGDNVKWKLDTSTGKLDIWGSGAMINGTMPWNEYKSSIKAVEVEKGVTSIGNRAFYNCTSLTSIEIPDSVTSIGYNAFYGCTSLKKVYMTDIEAWMNIKFSDYDSNPCYYGAELYLNNELVTSVVVPNNITKIGYCVFYGCTSITDIKIPQGVTSIGDYAFRNCTSLTSVDMGDSVTSIGDYAF